MKLIEWPFMKSWSNKPLQSQKLVFTKHSMLVARLLQRPILFMENIKLVMISEFLILGFPDNDEQPILISPLRKVKNGGKLF